MPIEMKVVFRRGWKADENERHGQAVVIRFQNSEDGKTLFEYAPKHTDAEWFGKMFKRLWEYDMCVKALLDLNGDAPKGCGGCGG